MFTPAVESLNERMPSVQSAQMNADRWRAGAYVGEYAHRSLRPVEVVLLAHYREVFSRRVLELGCGAGRLLGYFLALGAETHGLDIAPAMVEYCRRTYPAADVEVRDLSSLGSWGRGPFDGVFASYNVLDVLDDAQRRFVLTEIRSLIAPGGLLIFSSHNRDAVDLASGSQAGNRSGTAAVALAKTLLNRPASWMLDAARRLPRRVRNRRRLARLEQRTESYAILNDVAHDYGLLHYYITRDLQEEQLRELGYEFVECRDLEGTLVASGTRSLSPELHYVARPRAAVDS